MKVDWDELKRLHANCLDGQSHDVAPYPGFCDAVYTSFPAILAEREATQTITPGYALVPVEPTEAMIEAGAAAHASILHGSCLTASDLASKLYKAMLTAAKGEL